MTEVVRTAAGLEIVLSVAGEGDREELFNLYALVVEEGGAFPVEPPAEERHLEAAWLEGRHRKVMVARCEARLAGSYYVMPNYPGSAAHIANAGYMVHPSFRGRGAGTTLVEHSLEEAGRLGFDALMFNLVFESNPARRLYERLGFEQIGCVPDVVDGEGAVLYWRAL